MHALGLGLGVDEDDDEDEDEQNNNGHFRMSSSIHTIHRQVGTPSGQQPSRLSKLGQSMSYFSNKTRRSSSPSRSPPRQSSRLAPMKAGEMESDEDDNDDAGADFLPASSSSGKPSSISTSKAKGKQPARVRNLIIDSPTQAQTSLPPASPLEERTVKGMPIPGKEGKDETTPTHTDVETETDTLPATSPGLRPSSSPEFELGSAVVNGTASAIARQGLSHSRSMSIVTVKQKKRAKLAIKLREIFGVEGIEEVVAELPCWICRSIRKSVFFS